MKCQLWSCLSRFESSRYPTYHHHHRFQCFALLTPDMWSADIITPRSFTKISLVKISHISLLYAVCNFYFFFLFIVDESVESSSLPRASRLLPYLGGLSLPPYLEAPSLPLHLRVNTHYTFGLFPCLGEKKRLRDSFVSCRALCSSCVYADFDEFSIFLFAEGFRVWLSNFSVQLRPEGSA